MLSILKWFFMAGLEVLALILGLYVFFTVITDGVSGFGGVMRLLGLKLKLAILKRTRKAELQIEIEKRLAQMRKENEAEEETEEVKSEEPASAGDPVT